MRARRRLDLREALGADLYTVEKPARYVGGEAGALESIGASDAAGEPDLLVALSFPDLYEIGMSNNAVRILYDGLNRLPGLRCERVFAPAPDFERLLRERGLPLTTLESGFAVGDADIIGFSVGYELAATSILTILDRSAVPFVAAERRDEDPIVIGGGPALSNPHFLAGFLDAVWIGEAEDSFFELCGRMAEARRKGAGRSELLALLSESPHVWRPGKKTVRAIYGGFPTSPYRMVFPIPVLKAVQDHGTVEIMRGCPHGCRFCHAGYYYRPQRMKSATRVQAEVRELVEKGGYREITLASLSSGDYAGIGELMSALNKEWSGQGVSFQLPSLKVNSFTLPLIEALSEVRKSGLTFAVESPEDFRQLVINKDVSFDKIVEIIGEARSRGFKSAKFYFMLGLPVPGKGRGEAEAIVAFFERLAAIHPISYNVNVGIFVPKPHTPFQWCGQLGEEEAMAAVQLLRAGLRPFRSVKLSWHSPFVSLLESIMARGDERVGELIREAWRRGARLDAWEDHFDRELWRGVLQEASWDPIGEASRQKELSDSLPWDDVSIRVSKKTLVTEWQRSQEAVLTSDCSQNCTSLCGSCGDPSGIVYNNEQPLVEAPRAMAYRGGQAARIILHYAKTDRSLAYPHLGISDAMMRALQIAGLQLSHSEGFNPSPRMELTPPLPLGVSSLDEYLVCVLAVDPRPIERDELSRKIQCALPLGLRIEEIHIDAAMVDGKKRPSIGSILWGNVFSLEWRKGGEAIESLASSIAAFATEESIEGLSLAVDGGAILLRLPNANKRDHGISHILQACLDGRPALSLLSIEKRQSLGKDASGPTPLRDLLGFS